MESINSVHPISFLTMSRYENEYRQREHAQMTLSAKRCSLLCFAGFLVLLIGAAIFLSSCYDGITPCKSSVPALGTINSVTYKGRSCGNKCAKVETVCHKDGVTKPYCNDVCAEYVYFRCYDVYFNLSIPANITESSRFTCVVKIDMKNHTLAEAYDISAMMSTINVHVIGQKCYLSEVIHNNNAKRGINLIIIGSSLILGSCFIVLGCCVCYRICTYYYLVFSDQIVSKRMTNTINPTNFGSTSAANPASSVV